MKKIVKIFTLVLAVALVASVSACNLADKTASRREEYIAKGNEFVQTLDQSAYSAEEWAAIEGFVAEFEEAIGSVAAKSKMEVALKELKSNIAGVFTINDYIDAYLEEVDVRIGVALVKVLEGLNPETMGISSVTYNESTNHATFVIVDENDLIRNFADTGVCAIFQEMFADVERAEIEADNGATDTLENYHLTDKAGLKHHVGEHFIRLFVEDYAYAPLSYLVGHSATATVYFEMELNDGTVKTVTTTYSCSFVVYE
ncbi:MAG: hypothetical protein IJV67_05875 [Clostridia bacterium]|nr:hypothetical protein [Clostridia bacterium]